MGRNALFGLGFVVGSLALSACGSDVATPLPARFQQVVAGGVHSCGVLTDGSAYCWGNNDYGQLGDGSTTRRVFPVPIAGTMRFAMLTAGAAHTCGLSTAGAAYCWGFNYSGQLGDQTHTNRTVPTPVAGSLAFATLVAGGSYTCGLTLDGTAYCWGWNAFSQLGDGGTADQSAPKAVAGALTFASISANSFHTCAVTAAGAAYCWGSNDYGQLGTGDALSQPAPVAVSGGLTFSSVEAGYHHSCGVTTGGGGYCWGRNQSGQLGLGDSVGGGSQLLPVEVPGGREWSLIDAGALFSCGIEAGTGAGYCWGLNQSGQLGKRSPDSCYDENNNPYYCSLSPLAVGGGLTFSAISAATQHVCGLTTDGVAYCWGMGGDGQLGDGQKGGNVNTLDPVKVGGQP
jgi:alpha-tubulin suppressor-like RCC1 family protein